MTQPDVTPLEFEPVLTLLYCPGHLSFAPHVVLNEIGQPFKLECLSIKNGDTQQEAFRRINPKGKVPVLLTPEGVLTEASAILFYLALSFPEQQLLPKCVEQQALAIEWLNWLSSMMPASIAPRLHPYRFTDEEQAWPAIRQRGLQACEQFYQQIEQRLSRSRWAMGDGYSIVDPVLMIFYRWGSLLGLDMTRFNYWQQHTAQMRQRPAVIKTLSTENIEI